MKLHDFAEDLKFSHSTEDSPIWSNIYGKAFPGNRGFFSTRNDMELQRKGIDRKIILWSGKEIFVDEKARRTSYADILLEYISNDQTLTHGWISKPMLCDYIAYAILPRKICYLLPVPQLQAAWENHGMDWMAEYKTKPAKNKGYQTLNCPVPINELYMVIGSCLRVPF